MLKKKVRWGVLGAAGIATRNVIPAMQLGNYSEVIGLASRSGHTAKSVAEKLGIPNWYSSYEEMLEDPEIEAVYNPLPNHLHSEWTLKALKAGKHVLCEKPFFLNLNDGKEVIDFQNSSGLKVSEAFMVRYHPRWQKAKELVQKGVLGDIKLIRGFFSYNNNDPRNIRYAYSHGGGGLWDIGCYPVHISRYLLGKEPIEVSAHLRYDPEYNVDIFASGVLDFGDCLLSFAVGTQSTRAQEMEVIGDKKRMVIEMPFNPPTDRPCTIKLFDQEDSQQPENIIEFPFSNQYTLQGDSFSSAIIENINPEIPLTDSYNNTKILLALFESHRTGLRQNIDV